MQPHLLFNSKWSVGHVDITMPILLKWLVVLSNKNNILNFLNCPRRINLIKEKGGNKDLVQKYCNKFYKMSNNH